MEQGSWSLIVWREPKDLWDTTDGRESMQG